MKTALSIAGSDSCGGAGIQADIKTMTMNGVYAMTAITALTAQNTTGVRAIQEATPAFLKEQLDAVFEDIFPDAVKIGMVSSSDLVRVIAERLRHYGAKNIVVDPVMVATSGSSLMKTDAVQTLIDELLPLSTVITPNIPEGEILSSEKIESRDDMERAAKRIGDTYGCAVLLKGGHRVNDANDLLYAGGEMQWFEGKRIAMSGYGNVGWGIMKKIDELGGKVTYFAGPDGYIHDPDGVCGEEKLNFILEMRAKDPMHCKPYADKFGVEFVEGQKCWGVKDVDVYMPAATQNDVNMEWAKKIAESGVPYYIEVGNMPTTNDALAFLMSQKHITVAPSKAVNACGVSVSELEMAQNAQRIYWSAEEVDAKMESIMKNIYDASVEAAERYGLGYNLVAGANIAGFQKVADAMMAQGIF